jgi:hypothetical protein
MVEPGKQGRTRIYLTHLESTLAKVYQEMTLTPFEMIDL